MDDLKILLYKQRCSQCSLLSRIKERKLKIRKFMMFVSNALDDTESEILEAIKTTNQLDQLVSKHLETFGTTQEAVPNLPSCKLSDTEEDCLVAETVPDEFCAASPDMDVTSAIGKATIPETYDVALADEFDVDDDTSGDDSSPEYFGRASPNLDKHNVLRPESMDETIGFSQPSGIITSSQANAQDHNAAPIEGDRHSSLLESLSNRELTEEERERLESVLLSPVSNLLNDVLSVVAKPTTSHRHRKTTPSTSKANTSATLMPPPQQPYTQSSSVKLKSKSHKKNPTIIREDNGDCIVPELGVSKASATPQHKTSSCSSIDDEDVDVTALSQVVSPADIIVTKVKNKPVWPIGYQKPQGELVVEPAQEGHKLRKRSRQTRLDGFLSKANANSSSITKAQILSLSKRPPGHQLKQSATPLPQLINDSDSDDDIGDIALDVLEGPSGFKANVTATSTQKVDTSTHDISKTDAADDTTRKSNQHIDIPVKRPRYQPGDVVRGKARRDLPAYRCKQCYEYFSSLNLSEEAIQARLNEVCRHRAVKPPMQTPPDFWNMSIVSDVDSTPSQL